RHDGPGSPAARAPEAPVRPVRRAGPSRARWSARSRARQGASLALGPPLRRGFDLDGTLERAGDRQVRDGPSQVPRPCMALTMSKQDAAMDDMVEPQGARDVLPIPLAVSCSATRPWS